jgi:hypothetical protein
MDTHHRIFEDPNTKYFSTDHDSSMQQQENEKKVPKSHTNHEKYNDSSAFTKITLIHRKQN